jgi:hypothetical protein
MGYAQNWGAAPMKLDLIGLWGKATTAHQTAEPCTDRMTRFLEEN